MKIKLTEAQLKSMVKEAIRETLSQLPLPEGRGLSNRL